MIDFLHKVRHFNQHFNKNTLTYSHFVTQVAGSKKGLNERIENVALILGLITLSI
jgi:hypothetical protein